MQNSKHGKSWAAFYLALLVIFTIYVLMDTFVITRVYSVVASNVTATPLPTSAPITITEPTSSTLLATTPELNQSTEESGMRSIISTNSSYHDDNIDITITEYREYNTTIYVADITLANSNYLKTAFAQNAYGRNVSQTTSAIAAANNAILAINGDFYGARNAGYVLRNGKLYRQSIYASGQEDMVICSDGSFELVTEGSISAQALLDRGALQVLTFGPGILENGEITVTQADDVGKSMASNPRTAIGMIAPPHYVFVVSDGRTNQSAGLSLSQLAEFMQSLGVQVAYNLDGGGSSTMVFQGKVINNPTTNGRTIAERKVSDIVYIGY